MASLKNILYMAALAATASAYTTPTSQTFGALLLPDRSHPVTKGQAYQIRWEPGSSVETVSLVLCIGPPSNCQTQATAIVERVPASAGAYTWNVPCSVAVGTQDTSTGYGMLVIVDGTGVFQYSTQFSVLNGPACPTAIPTTTTISTTSSSSSTTSSSSSRSTSTTTTTSSTTFSTMTTTCHSHSTTSAPTSSRSSTSSMSSSSSTSSMSNTNINLNNLNLNDTNIRPMNVTTSQAGRHGWFGWNATSTSTTMTTTMRTSTTTSSMGTTSTTTTGSVAANVVLANISQTSSTGSTTSAPATTTATTTMITTTRAALPSLSSTTTTTSSSSPSQSQTIAAQATPRPYLGASSTLSISLTAVLSVAGLVLLVV